MCYACGDWYCESEPCRAAMDARIAEGKRHFIKYLTFENDDACPDCGACICQDARYHDIHSKSCAKVAV